MHIPSSQSQDVALLDFEEALSRSGRSGGYDAEKWLYVPDFYTEYRYILGTRGQNPLICIGVNPSTAAPEDLDNTLKSVPEGDTTILHSSPFTLHFIWPTAR